jgi:ketosteroid isomerase-like protein
MGNFRYSRWMIVAGLALALPLTATAGFFTSKTPHKRDVRSEVAAADQHWRDAQSNDDVAAMEKLLSDDYLGISGNGQVLTKAQQLDRMRSHRTAVVKIELSDQKIKLLGSTAIVTSTAEIDGHTMHSTVRSTRVYKRVAGVWELTSFEATPTRESHETPSLTDE